MGRVAFLATPAMAVTLQRFSRLAVRLYGSDNLPKEGGLVFVARGSTAIERLLLPLNLCALTGKAVKSVVDASFFDAASGALLHLVGAGISRDTDPDHRLVKTLLTGEADLVLFEEARHDPLSSAASVALRTEWCRQHLSSLPSEAPGTERLQAPFPLSDLDAVLKGTSWVVPVNITCYPLGAIHQVLRLLSEITPETDLLQVRKSLWVRLHKAAAAVEVGIRFGEALDPAAAILLPAADSTIASIPAQPNLRREERRLSRRYLASLSRLATVNLDHIFASQLKALPFGSCTEDDFRRRVFLLASRCRELPAVNGHESLQTGVTLLTDDRDRRYRDFLQLALETGVVTRREGRLVKERGSLSTASGENPLATRAREAAGFPPLRREVFLMAWLPARLVRSRVARLLERRALEEFEGDYRHFYSQDESKERGVGSPVLSRGASRRLGVVLVHGFLSAPREMAELAQHLNARGVWVYQVRLKGHGTAPPDLASRVGADWVESVDLGYALMSAACQRVVVGGFSFGAGVALDCASRIPRVAGVFAVCPPLRLVDISSRFAPAVHVWNRLMDVLRYQWAKMEFVVTVPERPQINYSRLPVSGVRELGRFMRELESKLSRIEAPVLVVQADGDPVVDPRGAERLFELLGSKEKEYLKFPLGRHGILAGPGSEEVHAAITSFVEGLLGLPDQRHPGARLGAWRKGC